MQTRHWVAFGLLCPSISHALHIATPDTAVAVPSLGRLLRRGFLDEVKIPDQPKPQTSLSFFQMQDAHNKRKAAPPSSEIEDDAQGGLVEPAHAQQGSQEQYMQQQMQHIQHTEESGKRKNPSDGGLMLQTNELPKSKKRHHPDTAASTPMMRMHDSASSSGVQHGFGMHSNARCNRIGRLALANYNNVNFDRAFLSCVLPEHELSVLRAILQPSENDEASWRDAIAMFILRSPNDPNPHQTATRISMLTKRLWLDEVGKQAPRAEPWKFGSKAEVEAEFDLMVHTFRRDWRLPHQ